MERLYWQCRRFESLPAEALYAILRLRAEVFVVEQECAYLDPDGMDQSALHVTAHAGGQLACYARIIPPGGPSRPAVIGRVVTRPARRGGGIGRELVRRALRQCATAWPDAPVAISAQQRLERFYRTFGFMADSEPYLEDGIFHVRMLLAGSPAADPPPPLK